MSYMKSIHKEKDTRDYNLSCLNQLKMPNKIKHEVLRVWCQLCQYWAQNKADLAKPTNNMANISLVISQCEYKNRDNANLNHHVKVEHGDIVYHCDQCDYEAKTRRLVGRHNKAKQDVVFPSLTFLCVNSSQLNCRACSLQVLGGIGLKLFNLLSLTRKSSTLLLAGFFKLWWTFFNTYVMFEGKCWI